MKFEELFQQPNALPSAPKVVQVLVSSFNDENVSIDDIAKILAADPVLSAKLLRVANSAYYHASRSVSTVFVAVAMLGFVTVRTLVISSGLVNGFKSMPGFDLDRFWRYSLHTAAVAKWLAQQSNQNAELAFTVGMTHAIGQLVIHAGMPEKALLLDKIIESLDPDRIEEERKIFGYDHADVGAELAARWKFPEDFSNTIRAVPIPFASQPFNSISAIIHIASWFARATENNLSEELLRSTYPAEIEAKLGLAPFTMLDKMPPLAELCNGLEDLIKH